MAQQDYVVLKKKDEFGMIALNKSVFQSIAKIVLDDERNVALADTSNPFKNALKCKIDESGLKLEVLVKVRTNVNVNETCSQLQNKIYENIKHMCEYAPDSINVKVAGFLFE